MVKYYYDFNYIWGDIMVKFDKIVILESIKRKLTDLCVGTYTVSGSEEKVIISASNIIEVLQKAELAINEVNSNIQPTDESFDKLNQELGNIIVDINYDGNISNFKPILNYNELLSSLWSLGFIKDPFINYPGENVNIKYNCMYKNTIIESAEVPQNTVYLDFGQNFGVGVLDHHKLSLDDARRYPCATTIVIKKKDFMLNNIDASAEEVTLNVHENPDFDCFASAYLASELLRHGEFPQGFEKLMCYAEKVDTGQMKLSPNKLNSLYTAICGIPFAIDEPDTNKKNDMVLQRGLELIEYTMERIKTGEISLDDPAFFPEDNPFKREIDLMKGNYNRYAEFVSDNKNVISGYVKMPYADMTKAKVDKALITKVPPKGIVSFKDWARGDGYNYISLTEYDGKEVTLPGGEVEKVSRVVIMSTPDTGVFLSKLFRELEIVECNKEKKTLSDESVRKGTPRFAWSSNADPFYECADQTKGETPGRGSLLSSREINMLAVGFLNRMTRGMDTISEGLPENVLTTKTLKELYDGSAKRVVEDKCKITIDF